MKPAVLKTFAFDWALCFRLCKVVYRFQNLVGLESPIKHIRNRVDSSAVLEFCILQSQVAKSIFIRSER